MFILPFEIPPSPPPSSISSSRMCKEHSQKADHPAQHLVGEDNPGDSDYCYLQASSTPNRASVLPDNDHSWGGYSQESFDDADFSTQPSPSPVFPRSRGFNAGEFATPPQHTQLSAFPAHIITAAERYKTQLLSKSGKYLAYTVFSGANRGVYYNWSAADRALTPYYKRSVKGFVTYDEAHCAWDTFVGEGQVPNGCSHPDPADNISVAVNFPRPNRNPVHNTPSMPSRQRSQPPLGSPLFNVSRGSPSPLTPAKPIRERSAVPPLSTRQLSAGPSTAQDGSDNEGNWWVVITGTEPGVYYGRAAGERAMGLLANPTSVRANSQSAADRLFVTAYCTRQVARLV